MIDLFKLKHLDARDSTAGAEGVLVSLHIVLARNNRILVNLARHPASTVFRRHHILCANHV
jgi:hypothetical protein